MAEQIQGIYFFIFFFVFCLADFWIFLFTCFIIQKHNRSKLIPRPTLMRKKTICLEYLACICHLYKNLPLLRHIFWISNKHWKNIMNLHLWTAKNVSWKNWIPWLHFWNCLKKSKSLHLRLIKVENQAGPRKRAVRIEILWLENSSIMRVQRN